MVETMLYSLRFKDHTGWRCRCRILISVLVWLVSSCFTVNAYQLTFQPRIAENLTYTDNLFLDSGDDPQNPKESDGYSQFTPGFTGQISTRTMGASLSYDFGYTRYFEWSSQNSWNHNMGMNGWYGFSRHTRLEVNDHLAYTSDPLSDRNFEITRPPDSTLPEDYIARRDREPYLTNYGNMRLIHQFGPDDSIVIEYGNGIRHDFGSFPDDGRGGYQSSNYMRHTPSALITYWFNSRWGVELEGVYDQGNFQNQDDTYAGTGRFRLNRRINPHFNTFIQYTFYTISYEQDQSDSDYPDQFSSDYDTHETVLGLNYSIAQDLTLECHAGAIVQAMDDTGTTVNFSGDLSLNKAYQHGSIRVYASSGQAQGVFTSESVGPSFYFESGISANYQILEDLGCNTFVTFRRDNYGRANNYTAYDQSGNDDNYGAGIGFNWRPYPWLGFNISYSFRKLDSGRDTGTYMNSYTENRGLLTITLTTPRPWRTTR